MMQQMLKGNSSLRVSHWSPLHVVEATTYTAVGGCMAERPNPPEMSGVKIQRMTLHNSSCWYVLTPWYHITHKSGKSSIERRYMLAAGDAVMQRYMLATGAAGTQHAACCECYLQPG